MKVIFDVNILISYGIGKHLSSLEGYLKLKNIKVWYNDELINEYLEVISRPAIRKIISAEKISSTLSLFRKHGRNFPAGSKYIYEYPKITDPNTDIDDIYLLKLCVNVKADFLVTGDKWLLQLKKYGNTSIISFKEFEQLIIN